MEELDGLVVRRHLRGSKLRLSVSSPLSWQGWASAADDGSMAARLMRSRLAPSQSSSNDSGDDRGYASLALDLEGCAHPNEACRAALDAVLSSSAHSHAVQSLELSLYQEESDEDMVIDEVTGKAAAQLLRRYGREDTGAVLQHLSLVNWFGYVPSIGFVRELCRGVSASTNLVSLEIVNCALPRGSHRFLSSVLRANHHPRPPLKRLAVDLGEASMEDLCDLFQALEHARSLTTFRVTPDMLPNDARVAAALERSVAANPSIGEVLASFPNVLEPFRLRLEAVLKANRSLSWSRSVWEVVSTTSVPPTAWPALLARLLVAFAVPDDPMNSQQGNSSRLDRAARIHAVYRHVIRGTLPTLLAAPPSGPAAVGPEPN
jgi:hypothetical protein